MDTQLWVTVGILPRIPRRILLFSRDRVRIPSNSSSSNSREDSGFQVQSQHPYNSLNIWVHCPHLPRTRSLNFSISSRCKVCMDIFLMELRIPNPICRSDSIRQVEVLRVDTDWLTCLRLFVRESQSYFLFSSSPFSLICFYVFWVF